MMTKKEKWIYIIFIIMPLVDFINGIFAYYGIHIPISLGQAYRAIVITLMLYLFFSNPIERRILNSTMSIFLAFPMLALIHLLVSRNVVPSRDISFLIQWIFFTLLYASMVQLVKSGNLRKFVLEKILDKYAIILPLTLIIPFILGLGNNTYGGAIGYKGFYIANNGISLFAAILFIYILFRLFDKPDLKKIIITLMILWCCVMLGTKSALLSIVIAMIFVVIRSYRKGLWNLIKTVFVILLIASIVAIIVNRHFSTQINNIFLRSQHMGNIYSNMLDVLTSGRVTKAEEIFNEFNEGTYFGVLINWIFGQGVINIISEIDELDLFFQFGIVGSSLFFYYIFQISKYQNLKLKSKYGTIYWFLLLYSFVTGHVFTNAMSSMVFALIGGLVTVRNKKGEINADISSYNNV